MKIRLKNIIAAVIILTVTFSMQGCADGIETNIQSSVMQSSVVVRNLTAYEKKILNESVETALNDACRLLYKGVLTGSITQNTTGNIVSFSDRLPAVNASPGERRRMGDELTLGNAIEYCRLQDTYTDQNIREYGFLKDSYDDGNFLKGTVIRVQTLLQITADYTAFADLDVPLSAFLDSSQLLA